MFEVGSFRAALHGGISRRAFLTGAASAPLAFGLPAAAANTGAKAKSVIVLWLWGAPSHLDTFDPKPNAPADIRGPFGTIQTKTTGRPLHRTLSRKSRPAPTASRSSAPTSTSTATT